MAIPGLVGAEHIGFTVPDLEQAHQFLIDVLGCAFVYALGPYEATDAWMVTQLGVDPRARIRELRFYRLGHGPNFEVFQYDTPEPPADQPRNSDIGGHHIALYVHDLDAAVAHLRAHDVEVMGEPWASGGAAAGQRWVYFRAPWGMQFELVSFPGGKAYEATADVRLWHPGDPTQ